jgi:hypothetical protein
LAELRDRVPEVGLCNPIEGFVTEADFRDFTGANVAGQAAGAIGILDGEFKAGKDKNYKRSGASIASAPQSAAHLGNAHITRFT